MTEGKAERAPRIITPIPKPLLGRVDDFRFANRLDSRAEAIRQLLAMGLAGSGRNPPHQKENPNA